MAKRAVTASGALAAQASSIVGRAVINLVNCIFSMFSLMRDTAAVASGPMSDAAVTASADITDVLAVISLMRDAAVTASGTMTDDPVAVEAELC